MKRFSLSILAICLSHSALADIHGTVVDPEGRPIPNARIDVVGVKTSVKSDAAGNFTLPLQAGSSHPEHNHRELHVLAPNFAHSTFQVDNNQDRVTLTLTPSALEIVNVIGLPWHASNIESAQPVSVLTGDSLKNRQASTLGETLKYQVGVHSTYYGSVASSPIIRGLEGNRVLITQNGLDAGDASRNGADHAVSTEASSARQIEILRGPATLFYGSGAIGGVVNVVDDRVPTATDTYGEWQLEHNSVADAKLASGSITTGKDNIAVHIDGFVRRAENYKLPQTDAETLSSAEGIGQRARLENSFAESEGINVGASYLLDAGYVGLSYGRITRQYGIPGHSHDHGDEHGDAHDEDHEHHAPHDDSVYADSTQDRWQLVSDLDLDNALLSSIKTRIGYTDYRHDEIDAGEIATRFNNKTREARIELLHHPLGEWRGAVNLHAKKMEQSAIGAEAVTPPSTTEQFAVALVEERHFGDVLVQLGARVEHIEISPDLASGFERVEANPYSLSAGSVWEFSPGYNLALSLTRAERLPSASELFTGGVHLGSGIYELGAFYEIEEHGDHLHIHQDSRKPEMETSNNIDLSLRKFNGDIGFIISAFYNDIENYYYLANTGLMHEEDHNHADAHEHHHDAIALYQYQVRDAKLYGLEGEWTWQINEPFRLSLTGDYIRAELKDGTDLPRIPPLRVGIRGEYTQGPWRAEASVQHYAAQNRYSALETKTAGYDLVDAQISYAISNHLRVGLKVQNLTNEEAYVHSSFLKDKAPLPARAVSLSLSGSF